MCGRSFGLTAGREWETLLVPIDREADGRVQTLSTREASAGDRAESGLEGRSMVQCEGEMRSGERCREEGVIRVVSTSGARHVEHYCEGCMEARAERLADLGGDRWHLECYGRGQA